MRYHAGDTPDGFPAGREIVSVEYDWVREWNSATRCDEWDTRYIITYSNGDELVTFTPGVEIANRAVLRPRRTLADVARGGRAADAAIAEADAKIAAAIRGEAA